MTEACTFGVRQNRLSAVCTHRLGFSPTLDAYRRKRRELQNSNPSTLQNADILTVTHLMPDIHNYASTFPATMTPVTYIKAASVSVTRGPDTSIMTGSYVEEQQP